MSVSRESPSRYFLHALLGAPVGCLVLVLLSLDGGMATRFLAANPRMAWLLAALLGGAGGTAAFALVAHLDRRSMRVVLGTPVTPDRRQAGAFAGHRRSNPPPTPFQPSQPAPSAAPAFPDEDEDDFVVQPSRPWDK